MVKSQFQEKYLKNPKIPVNIPFFWYVLSGILIFFLLVLMIVVWTSDEPEVIQSSTRIER